MSYKNPAVRVFNDINNLAEAFSYEFVKEVNHQLQTKERINVALSGGNTPKLFFQKLVERHEKPDWGKIFLFWGDERCVSPDNPESNFGMTKQYLLDHIKIPDENVKRIKGENNPDVEAKRYSEIIKQNLPEVNSLPGFEIIILGLGEDGHTASIFPDQMQLIKSNKICAASLHPLTKQKRITLTGRIINNSKKIFFLASGKNKSIIFSEIINEKGNYLKYPAYHIKPFDGEVVWFLDKEAASELK